MAADLSATLRNALLAGYETTFTAGSLKFRSGSKPAAITDPSTGTVGATITLPADCFTAPSGGSVSKNGTWSVAASASATIAHYELCDSGGTVHERGSVTTTGGGGDLTVDNITTEVGQTVTVTSWTATIPATSA